jgi:hypothetical protein
MMERLPQHKLYGSYSYHVALLKDFAEVGAEEVGRNADDDNDDDDAASTSTRAIPPGQQLFGVSCSALLLPDVVAPIQDMDSYCMVGNEYLFGSFYRQ